MHNGCFLPKSLAEKTRYTAVFIAPFKVVEIKIGISFDLF
jgi:hypothetical protein